MIARCLEVSKCMKMQSHIKRLDANINCIMPEFRLQAKAETMVEWNKVLTNI